MTVLRGEGTPSLRGGLVVTEPPDEHVANALQLLDSFVMWPCPSEAEAEAPRAIRARLVVALAQLRASIVAPHPSMACDLAYRTGGTDWPHPWRARIHGEGAEGGRSWTGHGRDPAAAMRAAIANRVAAVALSGVGG